MEQTWSRNQDRNNVTCTVILGQKREDWGKEMVKKKKKREKMKNPL